MVLFCRVQFLVPRQHLPSVSSPGGKAKGVCWALLHIRAFISFMRALPARPNHLPKVLLPKTITLGIKTSTYEFWRDTNIPTTAVSNGELKRSQSVHLLGVLPSFPKSGNRWMGNSSTIWVLKRSEAGYREVHSTSILPPGKQCAEPLSVPSSPYWGRASHLILSKGDSIKAPPPGASQ